MIELNGRRAFLQQKQENVFLVQAKSAAGGFHQASRRQFWQNEAKKLNLFSVRERG
jgi:hypothetical protein